jgi:hypothetical protein
MKTNHGFAMYLLLVVVGVLVVAGGYAYFHMRHAPYSYSPQQTNNPANQASPIATPQLSETHPLATQYKSSEQLDFFLEAHPEIVKAVKALQSPGDLYTFVDGQFFRCAAGSNGGVTLPDGRSILVVSGVWKGPTATAIAFEPKTQQAWAVGYNGQSIVSVGVGQSDQAIYDLLLAAVTVCLS